jgi:hypothetical protein
MDRMARGENCVIEGLINYDKKRRPFQHTLTVIAVGADGVDVARSGHDVAMLRAVSTDVSLSKEGIFDRSAGCTAQVRALSQRSFGRTRALSVVGRRARSERCVRRAVVCAYVPQQR